ncbi:hypothetical protein OIU78_017106 [Salix suchowensis]|nr:hypothetical protein OIU78_017106 [Salix suchowensis]
MAKFNVSLSIMTSVIFFRRPGLQSLDLDHIWISACYWPIVTGKSSRKIPGLQSLDLDHISQCDALKIFVD